MASARSKEYGWISYFVLCRLRIRITAMSLRASTSGTRWYIWPGFVFPQLYPFDNFVLVILSHSPQMDVVASDAVIALKRRPRAGRYKQPTSLQQLGTQKDSEAGGPIWVSRVTLPAPHNSDIVQALYATLENVSELGEKVNRVDANEVQGEWLGLRPGVGITQPEPTLSEHEGYQRLMAVARSGVTLLHVHGGAF